MTKNYIIVEVRGFSSPRADIRSSDGYATNELHTRIRRLAHAMEIDTESVAVFEGQADFVGERSGEYGRIYARIETLFDSISSRLRRYRQRTENLLLPRAKRGSYVVTPLLLSELSIGCPQCGAPPGRRCIVATNGKHPGRATHTHGVRKALDSQPHSP